MGVELVPERLGHRDHTGTKALLLAGRHGHQLADGLSGHGDESAERAEELPVVHEVGAKHLRGGELGRALGAAGGKEPPSFAGKPRQGPRHIGPGLRSWTAVACPARRLCARVVAELTVQ